MCKDKLSPECSNNYSGNCCSGLLENKCNSNKHSCITTENIKVLSVLHIEMCGVCCRETLHVDVLGSEKRCMNCLGRFRNKRAE